MILRFPEADDLIIKALKEDAPAGDITSRLTIDEEKTVEASLLAKEAFILCGITLFQRVFELIDDTVQFHAPLKEGSSCSLHDTIIRMTGNARAILSGERVALNLLQHLSGIATETARYVQAVEGTGCKIADTRKTTPLLRNIEKYAVTVGGGVNHRFGLSDAILIKENHIRSAGGIPQALGKVFEEAPHLMGVEIEVTNLQELQSAVECGASHIMLDNFTPEQCKEAVKLCKEEGVFLEASGNMTLNTIRPYAETGVDLISVGALTHSVKAVDVSLLVK